MPLFLQDQSLARYWRSMESRHARDPQVRITGNDLLDLLARVTKEPGKFTSQIKNDLKNAATPADELKIVQDNLGPFDKRDIAKILDTPESQTVPLDPEVRHFLAAVIGREPLDNGGGGGGQGGGGGAGHWVGDGDLKANSNIKNGLDFIGKPGQIIAALNMTTAATDRLHVDSIVDYVELGKIGADGKLHANLLGQLLGTHQNDYVRYGMHEPNSDQVSWLTIQADGLGLEDKFNAQLYLPRIGVAFDAQANSVSVTNVNEGREISEPNALVRFLNRTNGQGTIVKLDENGTFPKDTHIPGKAGDIYDVAVSDGHNNKDFSTVTGELKVPGGGGGGGGGGGPHVIAEPKLFHSELDAQGNPLYQEASFKGPLFGITGVPKYSDVRQGQLGDCYCPSAFAAMAVFNAEKLKQAITKNDDGTYSVTFKHKNWQTGKYEDVKIGPMSDELYVRPGGGPLYGDSTNVPLGPEDEMTMITWFPMFEKAYACWKGSYDTIGGGGSSATVFQDVLGMDAVDNNISDNAAGGKELFQWVKHAIDSKLPASLGTFGDSEKLRYTGSGIYPDHSYSVLDYKEKNGAQWIKMRNPWAEITPSPDRNDPDGGKFLGDGEFWIEAGKAAHFYETFFSVADPR